MKKFLLLLVAIFACTSAALAEKQAVAVLKADIHCDNCKDKILQNVKTLGDGIKDVKVDVPSQIVFVEYDAEKNSEANIIAGLGKLDVKAERASADKMPPKGHKPQCDKAKPERARINDCGKEKAGCEKVKPDFNKKKPECDKAKAKCDKKPECDKAKKPECDKAKDGCKKSKADCCDKKEMKKDCCGKPDCCKNECKQSGKKCCGKKDCCPEKGC
ncbi:MAG: heavy-metal-associated domain-containing protein [Muribaculaceae bacterium]|nr:heavy-metal-associated domain-containing protein [Muribaculaceae bacterium]